MISWEGEQAFPRRGPPLWSPRGGHPSFLPAKLHGEQPDPREPGPEP